MNIILFETTAQHQRFLPFTFTRPVADLRVGILTIREKWEKYFLQKVSVLTEHYLQAVFPPVFNKENVLVNAALLPSLLLREMIEKLPMESVLKAGNQVLAFKTQRSDVTTQNVLDIAMTLPSVEFTFETMLLQNRWDIFKLNGAAIEADFDLITFGRKSAKLSKTNTVIGDESRIFIEEGATVEATIFNTKAGAVYIGRDAEVMEGCMVRAPFALCEHAVLKMGAKIYGATTLGPHCKVGGEVNNSVFFAYSNKAHDGFVGNSVIGEWCNLGADTNNSNLKNNYAEVDVWSYEEEKNIKTGLQFCGLLMGDHSKSGINTMFNTGTTVGVCANVFGSDFPPKFIPSFTWGGAQWLRTFTFDKSLDAIQRMMERRNITLSEAEVAVLKYVFDYDAKWRK
ncbi:MAG: GlmU family protein [Chitinophagales bacterium]|nr:GlmU family protein [Chitinophagales bacterium]